MIPKRFRLFSAACALSVLALPALSQAKFPDKPVRIVVPYAVGGPSDIVTRIVGQGMAKYLDVPVVVENRAGANAILGMEYVSHQPGDGYTLVMFSQGGSVLNTVNNAKLPYDLLKDFRGVGNMAMLPQLAVTNNSLPVKTLGEFVEYAKAHPGRLSYGSSGVGGSPHMFGEWLKLLTGIKMTHVPYKGTGPATIDLIAGNIQLLYTEVPVLIEQVRNGKIKPLAVGTSTRAEQLPDVPTVAESGFPQLTGSNWFGLGVPASTPDQIVAVLNGALVKALNDPEIKTVMHAQGAIPDPMSAADYDKKIRSELARWMEIAAKINSREKVSSEKSGSAQ